MNKKAHIPDTASPSHQDWQNTYDRVFESLWVKLIYAWFFILFTVPFSAHIELLAPKVNNAFACISIGFIVGYVLHVQLEHFSYLTVYRLALKAACLLGIGVTLLVMYGEVLRYAVIFGLALFDTLPGMYTLQFMLGELAYISLLPAGIVCSFALLDVKKTVDKTTPAIQLSPLQVLCISSVLIVCIALKVLGSSSYIASIHNPMVLLMLFIHSALVFYFLWLLKTTSSSPVFEPAIYFCIASIGFLSLRFVKLSSYPLLPIVLPVIYLITTIALFIYLLYSKQAWKSQTIQASSQTAIP
ncbi:MAG: hypothetical protein SPD80_01360, partial [Atopobium sp.]